MAQILHESDGLTICFENLNYSADRLAQVWPTRFKSKGTLDPSAYAHSPEKLGNIVYGNRMGNGPDDGYKFRGRGLLQVTGRESYEQAKLTVRNDFPTSPDFVTDPDAVNDPQWCLPVAISEWVLKNCNKFADQDDIRAVTRAINGGLLGIAERIEWAKRTKAVWPIVAGGPDSNDLENRALA